MEMQVLLFAIVHFLNFFESMEKVHRGRWGWTCMLVTE